MVIKILNGSPRKENIAEDKLAEIRDMAKKL